MPIGSAEQTITNPRNPRIRSLQELRGAAARNRRGCYLADGIRAVAAAARLPRLIEAVIVAPDLLTVPFGRRLARRLVASGVPRLTVSADVYRALTQTEEPQGIAAVVRQRWVSLDDLVPAGGACWLAVESVRSAGNLGSVLRTAEAVGVAGVILLGPVGGRADPYDPAAVRASMGAIASHRFARATGRELAAWARRHRCFVVGTAPGAIDFQSVIYPGRVVVVVGNERRGLAAEHRAVCDRLVGIPMVGQGDSLNLAVATGVVLYEVFNQRRRACPGEPVTSRPLASGAHDR